MSNGATRLEAGLLAFASYLGVPLPQTKVRLEEVAKVNGGQENRVRNLCWLSFS